MAMLAGDAHPAPLVCESASTLALRGFICKGKSNAVVKHL